MSSRVENIIDVVVQGGQSERVRRIRVPNNATHLQVVLDNTRFEEVTDSLSMLVTITMFVDGRRNGSTRFRGGRADGNRPGQRILWSVCGPARMHTGRNRRLDVLLEASVTMGATVHVDFFP